MQPIPRPCRHPRLAPRGASGLKYIAYSKWVVAFASRPARGEWIEIFNVPLRVCCAICLAPRGASGLKFALKKLEEIKNDDSPREGRVD